MELRHLRYFVAVAEEKHITRAAERLGIQQPPLSQQIKVLERELGVQLLRRLPRGVELTEAGLTWLDEARAILAHLDRAQDASRRAARGERGRLSVGVTSTAPFHPLVARSIRAFREACPQVSFQLEECLSNEAIERLRSGQLDAAFVRTSVNNQDTLMLDLLHREPMVAALPTQHHLAQQSQNEGIDFHTLADETFILYGPPGTGMHDATIAACHAAGFNLKIGNLGASTQQAPRIGSTLSLVSAGLGVSLVPASLMRIHLDGVVYRHLEGSVQPTALLNLASRRSDMSPVVRQFVMLVRALTREVMI